MSTSSAAGRGQLEVQHRHSGPRLVLGSVVLVVLLGVLRNGGGTHPFIDFFATELAPKWPQLPDDVPDLFQFVLWSPIGPAVAHLIGVGTPGPYVALHVGVLCIGVLAAGLTAHRHYGSRTAVGLVSVVMLSPAMTVLLAWSGGYDVFTVVLSLILVVGVSDRWSFVVGALLAVSAFEHGLLILMALSLLAVAGVWGRARSCVIAMIGLATGGLGLLVWLRTSGVHHGRSYWIDHFGFSHFWKMAQNSWPLLAVSLFGVLWPLVFVLLRGFERRQSAAVACVLFLPVLPMLVTEDQTRVFAILTIAPLSAIVMSRIVSGDRTIELTLRWTLMTAWLPGFFVWKGNPHLADWGPWTALL